MLLEAIAAQGGGELLVDPDTGVRVALGGDHPDRAAQGSLDGGGEADGEDRPILGRHGRRRRGHDVEVVDALGDACAAEVAGLVAIVADGQDLLGALPDPDFAEERAVVLDFFVHGNYEPARWQDDELLERGHRGADRVSVWITRPGSEEPVHLDLGPAAALEEAVQAFLAALLTAAGLGLTTGAAALTGVWLHGLAAAGAVAICVLAYDAVLKRFRLPGAVAMGACRGANALVAGTAIFGASDIEAAIRGFRGEAEAAQNPEQEG